MEVQKDRILKQVYEMVMNSKWPEKIKEVSEELKQYYYR